MKRYWKGFLAMALVACNLIGLGAVGMPAVASADTVIVYGMTVNDLTDPIGIDTAAPTFGWKLQSDTVGQKQTAYQLVVATDEALTDVIWDSGKVESSDTTDISYGGDALADCTRYYWQVTVWDMNGTAYVSDVHFFETAFITGTPLDGASWIEVGAPAVGTEATDYTTNYTIEMDVISVTNAVSITFGGTKATTGSAAMWQVKDTGSAFTLVPHKWLATLSGTSATIAQGDTYTALKADGFKLKIAVNDDEITTYVNGEAVSVVTTAQLGYVPTLGFVGLRQATDESCVIDNLVVTDYASHSYGDVLESYDFSALPPTYTSDGGGTAQIVGGAFVAEDTADGWFGLCYFVENLTTSSLRYTVDVDVLDINGTFGLTISPQNNSQSNMLMWQFIDNGTYYSVKPHYYSGGWNAFGEVSFATGEGEYAALEDGFHVTMEVTDNRIKTYINGALVSDQYKSAFNNITPTLRYVIPRINGSSEGATLDNFKITDYSYVKEGQVIRYFDFEDPTLFAEGGTYAVLSGSTVENGVYTGTAVSGSYEWFNKVQLEQTPVVTMNPVNVHYTFEADVSCAAVASSLLFNMTDANNGLMWQIVRSDTAVKVRPHKIVAGKFTAYSDIDITSLVSPDQLAEGVTFKIEVADNVINTYVNGTLVNNFEAAQLGVDIFLGKFGTRVATGEVFTLDNLKAVDYIENAEGKVLFDYDCETFNPFFRGTLSDGKVSMDAAVTKTTGIHMLHAGTDTFRKEFEAAKEIASARLYVTSFGVFNAYLNGERVGNKNADGETVYDELAPGWTDQDYRSCYYTFDVTDYLDVGANTLAVGVNHGWKSIASERSNDPSTPFKLLAKMVITYTDGSTETVVTDDTWSTAHVGPIMLGELYQGEYYDATADVSFRQNGFDDSEWLAAKAVTFETTLAARDGGAIYVRKDLERAPQSITVYDGATDASDTQYGKVNVIATYGDESFILKAGETAVVDFGQNFAGWENITFAGARGTVVRIRHAEMLNDNLGLISRGNDGPEGSVYTANLRTAPATTHYVMSGEMGENYRPTTTYYGFRYIEITATADITVSKVCGEVATSVAEDTGSFETSDELINRLYLNTIWGQYSNYFGQATDCPQRDERLGYSGDAQVFVGTAVYNSQVKAFLRNFMQTLVEGQADDGAYGNTLPAKGASGSVWAGVAGWADAGIIVPYTYYTQYGDPALFTEYYDSMAKYMDYLNSMDLRIGLQFGDWLSYATNDTQMKEYLSYVYTIWDAQMMQEIATVLGKTEDVAKWETMEQKYLDIARPLYLDENGDHVMTQQTALLFALKVGLYQDDAAYARGKEALISAIKNNGNKLNTGFLGTSIIMETLVEIGEVELAYELLFQDADPSWLYSVKQGATTTWERWNSYTLEKGFGSVSMNSFNHYAYGCVAEFMYNTVLGINPDGEGYDQILLTPATTDKMTYVTGSYDSPNGLIESAWKLDTNERYTYDFTVPMNTTATVKLEKQAYASNYYVNDIAATDLTMENDGAAFLKEEDGYVYFEVTSGKFTFACEAIPPLSAAPSEENGVFSVDFAELSALVAEDSYTDGAYVSTADDTAINNWVDARFGVFKNQEGGADQYKELTHLGQSTREYATDGYSGDLQWNILSKGALLMNVSKMDNGDYYMGGQMMRKMMTLTAKGTDGDYLKLKNFEAEMVFNKAGANKLGAVFVSFRETTPGQYSVREGATSTGAVHSLTLGVDGVIVGNAPTTYAYGIVSTDGIIAGNTDDGNNINQIRETFDAALDNSADYKLTVRVVGTALTAKVTNVSDGSVVYDNSAAPVTIDDDAAGYLSFGVSNAVHEIKSVKVTKLDENGEITDIFTEDATDISHLPYSHGNITVADAEKTETGYKYTVTVAPDAGYELRAGSLIVTDTNGTKIVPTRVGYRAGGDASQYVFETTGGGTVSAEFYQPTKEDPNIGWVGTSVHEEDSGLRFVHRVNIDADGYMTMDGEKVKVSEYGLLLASGAVLKNAEDLDIETANESAHVHQFAWPATNKYYDLCSDYADIAIHVKNIAAYNGQNTDLITRVYLVLESGEVIYGDVAVSSYNKAAGLA